MRKDWINTDLTFQRADKPYNAMYYLARKVRTKQKYMANNWGNQSWITQIFVNKYFSNVAVLIYRARIFCIKFTPSMLFFILTLFREKKIPLTILRNLNFEIPFFFWIIR